MKMKWFLGAFAALALASGAASAAVKMAPKEMSDETKQCLSCHEKDNPGLVQSWGASKHYGANVGCYECHAADEGDVDAYIHDKKKAKLLISTIVSPKDCANCHEKEAKEMDASHHAVAGQIMGSLDNVLAEVVEGANMLKTPAFPNGVSAAAANGCWQCHGSVVKVNEGGQLDPATWPNNGIGRLNPDGSKGSCSACHSRHSFSAAQARQPENCGKCHMGPDHPQIEIYNESKHGLMYQANKNKMNLDSSKWIVGVDYWEAPTCATCHMSATRKQPITHDVGDRLYWENKPPISKNKDYEMEKYAGKGKLPAAERREKMKDVCVACHENGMVNNFYTQYDALVELYNHKYAKPGLKLIKAAKPLLKPGIVFRNEVEWYWWELWHHEGRRARMAASMQGPDITHWEGTYDLAKTFYTHYIPALEELVEESKHGNAEQKAAGENLAKVIDEVLNMPSHQWFLGKEDPAAKAERMKRAEEFQKRYGDK